jgi:hypothetical protein
MLELITFEETLGGLPKVPSTTVRSTRVWVSSGS